MKRLLLTASMAALMLAACAPQTEAPAEESPAGETVAAGEETVTAENAPLPVDLGSPVFEETTGDYSIRVTVDSRIAAFQPVLAEDLMTSARGRLEELKRDAVRDGENARVRAAETGEESWFRPYSMDIRYTRTAQTEDVISIQEFTAVDTGGAHPNYVLSGIVQERGDEYPLSIDVVISDFAAYGAQIKSRLVDARSERAYNDDARQGVPADVEEILGEDDNAGMNFGKNFIFEPSTEAGRFGGITVLFSPYDVGSYAEGSYEITIPAAELSGMLTPAWAPLFGGEPVLAE